MVSQVIYHIANLTSCLFAFCIPLIKPSNIWKDFFFYKFGTGKIFIIFKIKSFTTLFDNRHTNIYDDSAIFALYLNTRTANLVNASVDFYFYNLLKNGFTLILG